MEPQTVVDQLKAMLGEFVSFVTGRLKSLASRKFVLVTGLVVVSTWLLLRGMLNGTAWAYLNMVIVSAYVLSNALQKVVIWVAGTFRK